MLVAAGTRRAQAKNTMADMIANMAMTIVTHAGQPPIVQARAAERRAKTTADKSWRDIKSDRRRTAGFGGDRDISG